MPSSPPDAVSGAATPEPCYGEAGFCYIHKRLVRFCRKEGLEIRKPFDKLHDPPAEHPSGACSLCGGVFSPCACKPYVVDDAEPVATPEAQIPECVTSEWYLHQISIVNRKNAELESQLAALRVERDRAWNEAIEAAAQLVSRIYPNATKYDIERLARPIPAEPAEGSHG